MRRSRARKFQSPTSRDCALGGGPSHELLERARRHMRKGEQRRAWLTLQEACCVSSDDARVWALYAAYSRRMNRLDEAEKAFAQALYLRERQRDEARAGVLRRLLEELRSERCAA
jgi:Flp pilus assembly protein TadD